MIKEVDEKLQMLNSENYDVQFKWNNEEEIKNDLIEYFDLDEEDFNYNVEEYILNFDEYMNTHCIRNKVDKLASEFVVNLEKGEFVYSSLANELYTLDEALDYELKQATNYIEQYDRDLQEEILEHNFKEVTEIEFKINDFDEVKEKALKDNICLENDNDVIWHYMNEEEKDFIKELQEKYNIDYIEETTDK